LGASFYEERFKFTEEFLLLFIQIAFIVWLPFEDRAFGKLRELLLERGERTHAVMGHVGASLFVLRGRETYWDFAAPLLNQVIHLLSLVLCHAKRRNPRVSRSGRLWVK